MLMPYEVYLKHAFTVIFILEESNLYFGAYYLIRLRFY